MLSLVLSMAAGMGKAPRAAADTQETLASLNYSFSMPQSDAVSLSDMTLNKTKYGTGKKGYSFTLGTATLYASLDGTSKRKLEWSKEESTGSTSKEKYYTDSFSGTSSVREPVMSAGKKNKWGKNPYFEVQLATTGYEKIQFSAYIGASKKGARDYRISYAVGDSTTFTAVSGSELSLKENKVMEKISGTIPANNEKLVKIRIEVTSAYSINGKNMLEDSTKDSAGKTNAMKGEVAINHIVVTGTKATQSTINSQNSQSSASEKSSNSSTAGTSSTAGLSVKKITLSKSKLTLKKKKSAKLKVTVKVTPQTSANVKKVKNKLKWTSSNKKVATVSKNGKIKAKKKGKATITVKYSKKIKAVCKVVVK
jgi:hypothetical protein